MKGSRKYPSRLALLLLGLWLPLSSDFAAAQTPEPALVLHQADLFDADGNVVGRASEGDVLVVLAGGGKFALITASGPEGARQIETEHISFPNNPPGKALLEKLIAAGTTNPEHYHMRATNRWYEEDYEGMVADYTLAIKVAPQDIRGYQGRVSGWIKLEKYDQALADLEAISRIDPKQRPNTLHGLLSVYRAQNDWPRQIEVYTELLANERIGNFAKSQALAARGHAHEALSQWEQAAADYTAALQLNPNDREATAGLERLRSRE